MKWMLCVLCVCILAGCSTMMDAPANIVGVSTRDIESYRGQSVYQAYTCSYDECFEAVVSILQDHKFVLFSQDGKRGVVVVMGVPGAVDTTEVGILLERISIQGVKVSIASRSTMAKRVVAKILLAELGKRFSKN